ncbi:MAG: hypothetical protein ACK5XN_32240 [Bacteroidota bacterium]
MEQIQRTVKLKGSSLFSPKQWMIIRRVVEIVNDIVMKISMLSKLYYLQQFNDEDLIVLDKEFYDLCSKVVTDKTLSFRKGTDQDVIKRKKACYDILNDIAKAIGMKKVDLEGLSISFILSYSFQELETAMLNNIEYHYLQHINRFMYTHLYKTVTDQKPKIAQARNHVLFDKECPGELFDWCNRFRHILMPDLERKSFNEGMKANPWIFLKHMVLMSQSLSKEFPNVKLLSPIVLRRSFIPKHIHIDTNALVQLFMYQDEIKDFVDWYFDPISKEYPDPRKPNLKGKASLGSSFYKVFGDNPRSESDDFLYQRKYWRFICKFNNPKLKRVLEDEKRGLHFGNSITTDGCSVSFNMVSILKKKKKTQRTTKPKKSTEERDEFFKETIFDKNALYLGVDPGKRDLIFVTDGYNTFKYTSSQRAFDTKRKYFERRSMRKRKHHVIKGFYQKKDSVIPNYYHPIDNPTLSEYEEQVLSLYNSKSCNFEEFAKWCKAKLKDEALFKKIYQTPMFRNDRFSKYVLTKKSEDLMIHRLQCFIESRATQEDEDYTKKAKQKTNQKSNRKTKIKNKKNKDKRKQKKVKKYRWNKKRKNVNNKKAEPVKIRVESQMRDSEDVIDQIIKTNTTKKEYSEVILLYGNWGKSPNLPNSAPTPGIGLRRKIHTRLRTYTINEQYTSKTCPCCKEVSLEKAILRQGENSKVPKKHHLLRCENGMCCSRWWNRNVAGSYNILYNGIKKLRGASEPPQS